MNPLILDLEQTIAINQAAILKLHVIPEGEREYFRMRFEESIAIAQRSLNDLRLKEEPVLVTVYDVLMPSDNPAYGNENLHY